MPYDFKAARQHRELLVSFFRRLLNLGFDEDGTWDWELKRQIVELDGELELAHRSVNGKIAAGQGDYCVIQVNNIVSPIVPQWGDVSNP